MSDLPPVPAIEQALVDYAKETCGASRVEVRWIGLGEKTISGEVSQITWTGDPCRLRPELRLSYTLHGERTSLTVRSQLSLWKQVPVTVHDLTPGTAIGDTRIDDVPLEDIHGQPRTVGVARRLIKAGEPLDSTVVVVPPDIERDQPVALRVSRGALVITAPGRTLQSARVGEKVKVLNEATRVALEGTLIDSSTVELP